MTESNDVPIKSIIGGSSPIQLVADVRLEHLTMGPHATHELSVFADRADAVVVVAGEFEVQSSSSKRTIQMGDFLVVEGNANVQLNAGSTGGEVVIVNAPTAVPYPVLAK